MSEYKPKVYDGKITSRSIKDHFAFMGASMRAIREVHRKEAQQQAKEPEIDFKMAFINDTEKSR